MLMLLFAFAEGMIEAMSVSTVASVVNTSDKIVKELLKDKGR